MERKYLEKMLDAMEANFSDESLIAVDPTIDTYLQSRQVNYDNLCSVQKLLLSVEDATTLLAYAQLSQYNVRVRTQGQIKSNYLWKCRVSSTKSDITILSPKFDEIHLGHFNKSLPAKSIILETLFGNIQNVVGSIQNIKGNELVFKNEDDFFRGGMYDVRFSYPRVPFDLMCNALNIVEKNSSIRRYLFPVLQSTPTENSAQDPKNVPKLTLLNASIRNNAEQLQAVQQIVAGQNPQAPYVVFGPPGTGKTTTVVEAILQLHLKGNNRILVTAGSNSACDTIAIRISEGLQSLDNNSTNVMIRFHSAFYKVHSALTKQSLAPSDNELLWGSLSRYKIIVATLCCVGRMFLYSQRHTFTHVFIDEAAASTEAESLMAISYKINEACQFILSGDNKQLGPVIKSHRAASLGFDRSLMDRLLDNQLYKVDSSGKYDETLQTRLRRNYRSHPEIVGIYNKLFYNGELIPLAPPAQVNQAANWSELRNEEFPIIFQAVIGKTMRDNPSTSSFNQREAHVVCWYVMKLLTDGLGSGIKVTEDEIGIITPYLAQCERIKRLLRQECKNKIEVGSVEKFQGREKNIIIASMVSSFESIKFVSNPRRLNVLLSRAKSLMILIGNPITLRKNKSYAFIIDECKRNRNFLSDNLVEKRKLKEPLKKTANKVKKNRISSLALRLEKAVL
ncbi:putative helicase mov-10-B.1 [Drosophila sulfurigaster albostrigata]|uniref:putative helicase mov-10-B.1 n=1 Tax=Drosophila sulfurigaster albostrigata TaxID=89887 RepID=UPI002D21D909|nr:putative helicase mov-10-B.1 [Drosophila sulfurigaster albostrigata]